MTPKDIHKIFIPQKIFIFLKTLKGIEIQNFEPQNGASPRMNENIIVPPPLHPLLADRDRGRGRPDSNNRTNSDKGVFCCCFFLQLYFFTVQKGRTIYRGGGGGGGGVQQLFFFFFFFFLEGGGGGVGGVQILISIETYITCYFSGGGGGGVRTTYPSLDSRMVKK